MFTVYVVCFTLFVFIQNGFRQTLCGYTQASNHGVFQTQILRKAESDRMNNPEKIPGEVTVAKRTLELPALPKPKRHEVVWANRIDDYMHKFPGFLDLWKTIAKKYPEKISFQLPRLGALSGTVVQHCSTQLNKLFNAESPLIWKIGITHCAVWRWGNSMYGYKSAKEKWFGMIVLYLSHEPYGPAMLEACLIDKFGTLDGFRFPF